MGIKRLDVHFRGHELHRHSLAPYYHNQSPAWVSKSRLPFSWTLVDFP